MKTVTQRGDAPRRLRRRPSTLKGRYAIAPRRPPAALDPGASAAPDRPTPRAGQKACPRGARRSLPITRSHQSEVSTVSGEAHDVAPSVGKVGGTCSVNGFDESHLCGHRCLSRVADNRPKVPYGSWELGLGKYWMF